MDLIDFVANLPVSSPAAAPQQRNRGLRFIPIKDLCYFFYFRFSFDFLDASGSPRIRWIGIDKCAAAAFITRKTLFGILLIIITL